ncbi:metal-dependent hydrolase [Maribacter chungangensis]|uniref:Metal-dependent hydrolase n=1 Tax=Maribacter chungangensis TaxID=1069117 RepID=A0ABW3AZC2_9FLAO
MDSLTQIVLGAAVGEAVLGRKVGNKAMVYGAIAGTIPDLDIIARYFTDTVTATEIHRGFSHSVFFAILMSPVFGWLVWKIHHSAKATWRDWSWLFFWGLFTHPILDAFTTWGTQLFWPFDLRLAFQNIFVIDPLYTLPFLFFLILAAFQRRTLAKRSRFNRLGLTISTSYLALTLVLKAVAYRAFTNSLDAQGIVYTDINIRPSPMNTILWTANIDTKDAYLIGNYSFFDSQEISFRSYPKNHSYLGELREEDKIKRLINIAEGWYTITKKEDELYFNDLRFGLISLDPTEEEWAFSYLLQKKDGNVTVTEKPKFRRDAQRLLSLLWDRIWGN